MNPRYDEDFWRQAVLQYFTEEQTRLAAVLTRVAAILLALALSGLEAKRQAH